MHANVPRQSAHPAAAALVALLVCAAADSAAQMVTGERIPGYHETFGLDPAAKADYAVQFIECSAPGNVLWPGDKPTFTFQLVNRQDKPIKTKGKVDVIAYGTKGRPGDIWKPDMFRIGHEGSAPIDVDVPAKGFVNVEVHPKIPSRFGGYALVADLGAHGRQFVTSCVRTFRARPGRVQFPKLGMDVHNVDVLRRLGCKSIRYGVGYKPTTEKDFDAYFQRHAAELKKYRDANVSVIVEFGGGAFWGPTQPLGRPRPWLDEKGVMKDTKFDLAWLPSYDKDFQTFCKRYVTEFGWPKGPVVGLMLWNEPWEGLSISGWGADMPRYRAIYTAMCRGAEEAMKTAGVKVLLGGCDSSSNTFDKFFGDGKTDFLKWLDFCSIHYQGMFPPSTVKAWVNRKHPNGRVRIWDTESWVANCDDRVAAVIATNMSTGHDRAVGIYGGNICTEWHRAHGTIFGPDGKRKRIAVSHTWSVAAAVGAAQHFIGERDFRELLFRNGLPWVMVFNGRKGPGGKANPEDGTIVVVGDIGDAFGHNALLFRTARGLAEVAHKAATKKKLAALPPEAPEDQRRKLEAAIREPETLGGATMTLSAGGGKFTLYDFYGNPLPAKGGRIVVPLDHRGFFLRSDGSEGSFAALVEAVRTSRVEGIEPLATVCHDMLARIEKRPTLRLSLTNVLNRPVAGTLSVTLGRLKVEAPRRLRFQAHETKLVNVKVVAGKADPTNRYPLALTFDAGGDGTAVHEEDMRVNVIAHRTVKIDGKLDDWAGLLPQTIAMHEKSSPSLTEQAWHPYRKFDRSVKKGLATGYLAWDAKYFYFAAKIADDTPHPGMVRFETRNDDEYYYPEVCSAVRRERPRICPNAPEDTDKPRKLVWPNGVRRYSYRKDPELPAGNFPNRDNVQIAFNVLPPEQKPWYPCPPGTIPGYIGYIDTDYEYALNPVADKYGGGVEIWRLNVPGMPRKHFYPRQGRSPFDGPVKDGKLAVVRDQTTRIVEAAIPFSEIPHVKQRLDAGKTIKFSFRVNDDAGVRCLELSRERSVAKINNSFHVDWVQHWANELEFAFER